MRALTHTEEDTLYAKALKELKYGDPTVSKEERHKLYRKLCKEFHPDLNPEMLKKDPNSEIIKQINIAYNDIKNGTVRHINNVQKSQPQKKTSSYRTTNKKYNPNWKDEYKDPIDMTVLYQKLDKTCKKVATLRAAKKKANEYIKQVEQEVHSIERQVALVEVWKQTSRNQLRRLSVPFPYRWCMDLYQTICPPKNTKKDKALQIGIGVIAGLETFVLGAAYIAIVPYPVVVLLAAFGTKKTADVICKKTGIQTRSEKEKEKYQVACHQAAKNQFGLNKQKNNKIATKEELSDYRSKLDQKLLKATSEESKILSEIRKASSYNARAYQEAYARNNGYANQNGYSYSKRRV